MENQNLKKGSPTFAIKNVLKAEGFQWHTSGGKGWAKSFPAEGFAIERLQGSLWAAVADGIEVRIFDDHDALVARYSVNSGQWRCIVDRFAETIGTDV